MGIDRRLLLKSVALGAGVLALPAWAQVSDQRGFTHGVASGEPGQDRVLLWTRYRPAAGGSGILRWEVSPTADFARVVAGGEVETGLDRDWCLKPLANGLAPGEWYYYRFVDLAGQSSPIGRTRTLPDGPVGQFTLGVFSCSNLPFGYFNAYGHAAARGDIDLIVHLGDYLYEYEPSNYPSAEDAVAGRAIYPDHELLALADYRLRYATYRLDPDLQRLHQFFPFITMWDDHESANNSWQGGAQNHQPATEGDWSIRKAAAVRAYREWLPVSDDYWTSYRIGDLAELFRLESRLVARTEQLSLTEFLRGRTDIAQGLAEFRDGPWQSPERTLLGLEQEAWLGTGLHSSVASGVKWQVLAQEVIMGSISVGPELAALRNDTTDAARGRTELALAAARAGLPNSMDMWDGYPAARARLLKASQEAAASLIVLSGDSHNAWAFELDGDGGTAGVEFAGHSVSSPGNERTFRGADPAVLARAFLSANPQLKWTDTSRRGYLTLELTPQRATGEWVFLDTVRRPSLDISGRHRMSVVNGTNRFAA